MNGTTYHSETPAKLRALLETLRSSKERVHIYYGDTNTGRAWGDVETGRVGRSTGSIKIPICLHNARSIGGGAILDHCIVKIETTRAPRRVLYAHPMFHKAPLLPLFDSEPRRPCDDDRGCGSSSCVECYGPAVQS